MTLEEFNNRTKQNVTEDEFSFINRVYMAAGDCVDKDVFCQDFPKNGLNTTLVALTDHVETAESTIAEMKRTLRNLAIFIAKQAEECSSTALRKKAIQMMGEREYITWKIENGKNLWQLDLELIKELINQ